MNLQTQPLKLGLNHYGDWDIFATNGRGKPDKSTIYLAEETFNKLQVRTRRNADNIKTVYGHKKLQDLFVDAKISKDRRDSWPVVCLSDMVIWVPGLAVCRDLKQMEGIQINAKEKNAES